MKRSPINKMSSKKASEKRIEEEIRQKLLEEHGGLCQNCGSNPGFLGLSLHHIVFKSRGGKTTEENCCLICSTCHEVAHNRRRADTQGRIF
jgi:5-methylcytosine-specific restriction endonuclease McrA